MHHPRNRSRHPVPLARPGPRHDRRLAQSEATVAELIAHVGLSQPLVSWHVGRLRAAGVIETRRKGRETVCRLREEAFSEFAARERAVLGVAG
jgi:DNA-binding transcriptional ArsR family regulator